MIQSGNLLADVPVACPAETFADLIARPGVRIERIVSYGQATPAGEWLQQDESEFVLVVAGAARLRFEDEGEPRSLAPGDWLHIPAHRRHRVDWTAADAPTIWLAVHCA